jgi:hypothetical protein
MLVRAAALELPRVDLSDALRICSLIHRGDPDRYEQAAIRWLGRLCLEHRELGFDELAQGLAALQALPLQPAPALDALRDLCVRVGLDTRGLAWS